MLLPLLIREDQIRYTKKERTQIQTKKLTLTLIFGQQSKTVTPDWSVGGQRQSAAKFGQLKHTNTNYTNQTQMRHDRDRKREKE